MALRFPAEEGILTCQFYSSEKLNPNMRVLFELPGDPYDRDPKIAEAGRAYLKNMGVFFYRDELHSEGLIIDEEKKDQNGFNAWKYSASLDFNTLKIREFDEPTADFIKKNGDACSWIEWEHPKNILSFDKFSVQAS